MLLLHLLATSVSLVASPNCKWKYVHVALDPATTALAAVSTLSSSSGTTAYLLHELRSCGGEPTRAVVAKTDDDAVAVSVVPIKLSSKVVHTVSKHYLSFASGIIGGCGKVDWHGPKLRYLASQLAPAVMRLGGTESDCARYVLPTTKTQPPPTGLPVCRWGEMNVTIATWTDMIDFVGAVGVNFTFDLNELDGRHCDPTQKDGSASFCVGDWDPANTRDFLTYIKKHNLTRGLIALELGNELTRAKIGWKPVLTINQTIQDMHAFAAVLQEVWPDAQGEHMRPLQMGPATATCVEEDVHRILTEAADVLDIYSFHDYPDGAGCGHVSLGETSVPNMWSDLVNASWLRENGPTSDFGHTYGNASACVRAYNLTPGSVSLWLTESNAAYQALQNGSNAFVGLYWYAVSLGQYAQVGLSVHTYFDFVGSGLSMLGCDPYLGCGICAESRLEPNPSYFLAVLHKRLVGTGVLLVTQTGPTNDAAPDDRPLVFAHCARNQGVVLMWAHPSQKSAILDIDLGTTHNALSGRFEQYTLTPSSGSINSTSVSLNGRRLALTADDTLPDMGPVAYSAAEAVVIPGGSIGFVVFPDAKTLACAERADA